ncbi:hypothetical protein, partial [Thiolapillus sp.]|uniref:hypothetical protein n=2 Tax=Thiolapillus sp. TaxID=2017437 RepID=UPI0025EADF8F
PRSEAYFVFPLAQGTPGKQCGLAATGDYQPSLRSPWLAAYVQGTGNCILRCQHSLHPCRSWTGRKLARIAHRSPSSGVFGRRDVAKIAR